ncbi:hypothetical protein [Pseudophaeobacter profundi]|uniref:hypothetical protein n=1 Tax=Pseudophaeobacter profundi TaxID=3034152 RepID=UPI002432C5DC|nr:hypothetical protein [Pseudophaeobacter profundi]
MSVGDGPGAQAGEVCAGGVGLLPPKLVEARSSLVMTEANDAYPQSKVDVALKHHKIAWLYRLL